MSKKRTNLVDALKIDENVEACSKAYAGEVPSPKEKRRLVQVYMDEETAVALMRVAFGRKLAGERGADVSSIMREAAKEWLEKRSSVG